MRILRYVALSFALMAASVGLATPAAAQATRTWVSGVGDDANPCSRTAPCKTFPGAISKTAASGEIDCLDPGGFGTVTITKAITLKCDYQSNGGILGSGTNAVVVNAGPADAVVLSGLDFEGVNSGVNGVVFNSGGSLVVVDCIFRNFLSNGIFFAPGGDAALHVIDTTINHSGQSGTFAGIYIVPSGVATADVTVTRTQITGGTFGIVADGSFTTGAINGVIGDSVISHNAQNGVTASNGTAAHVTLSLDNVVVSGNKNKGLSAAGSNAGMLVGNSTVFSNNAGLATASGAVLASYGNNRVNGNNGADGAFTASIPTK